jgi:hypothetical protein
LLQPICIYICRMKTFYKTENLDHLGIVASLACAIHCAALPFIITALPLLGLEFLANKWVEIFMICLSIFVGVYSLKHTYKKHKSVFPVVVLIIGFALIACGHFAFENLEAILVPLGGISIAAAHIINWHYNKICRH